MKNKTMINNGESQGGVTMTQGTFKINRENLKQVVSKMKAPKRPKKVKQEPQIEFVRRMINSGWGS